jgi:hypothetical protein
MATGWLKPHGALGFLALGGLAFAGYALSQAQNWEALLRLLGRGPKPPDPPPAQGSLEVMQSSVPELVLASPAMPVNP